MRFLHFLAQAAPPRAVEAARDVWGEWLRVVLAALSTLFLIEAKLVVLFFLLSATDVITSAFFTAGALVRIGRFKAAMKASGRFLQNVCAALVFVWISNGFELFDFLGTWVIAYVCLRIARFIINAITPAESDLRQIWQRFWEVFYVRNADVIDQATGEGIRTQARESNARDALANPPPWGGAEMPTLAPFADASTGNPPGVFDAGTTYPVKDPAKAPDDPAGG